MLEDPRRGRRRVEHGHEPEPPAAPGARKHVDFEDTAHQVGPAPAAARARAGARLRLMQRPRATDPGTTAARHAARGASTPW